MKKLNYFVLVLLAACFVVSSVDAQKRAPEFGFDKGDFEISAGIGLVPTFVNIDANVKIPPLSMVLSYRLKKHLSLGAYFGHSSTTQTQILDPDKNIEGFIQNDFYTVGLRFEGHHQRDRMDFYGGAMIAYNFSNITTDASNPVRLDNHELEDGADLFTYSGFIGVKYLATERLGIFGEVGYGVSLVNLGVSYKL